MPSIPKQPKPSFHLTTTVLRAPGQAASGPPWGTQQGEARECRATLRCPGPSRGTVSWDPGTGLGIQERLQGLSAQERQIQGIRQSALGSRGSRGKVPKATSSHTPGQERQGWDGVRGWSQPSLCPPGDMLGEKQAVNHVICDCSSQKLGNQAGTGAASRDGSGGARSQEWDERHCLAPRRQLSVHRQLLYQPVGDVPARSLARPDDLHHLGAGSRAGAVQEQQPGVPSALPRSPGSSSTLGGLLTCPRFIPKYRATGSPAWILGSWFSRSLLGSRSGKRPCWTDWGSGVEVKGRVGRGAGPSQGPERILPGQQLRHLFLGHDHMLRDQL